MKPVAIGWVNVKRMFRERSNIFFVFIFPIALIFLIGAQFGGGVNPVVALYLAESDPIAVEIAAGLESAEDLEFLGFEDRQALIRTVERGNAQAGVLLPPGMEATAIAGEVARIEYVARPDGLGNQLQAVVGEVIAEVMKPVGAAQFAASETGRPFEATYSLAQDLVESAGEVSVEVTTVGEALFPSSLGRFDFGAPQQLVLFVFLNAMAGSSALILTRQLGISRRMLASPTRIGSIVVGESLGRFGTGLVQGVYIMIATLIVFGVNWGDPIGATLILVLLSAVGAGAAMLMGSVFSNDQQAGGISVVLSLGLAALGGAMLPIELFSPTMQRVAHITPHAWALDGFSELIRRGGTTADIVTELGVLALYAGVLLALATWRLRVAITRP